jgi:hypothetical protein
MALVQAGWWKSWERASGVTSTQSQRESAHMALNLLCASGSAYACAGQGLMETDPVFQCQLFRGACDGTSAVGCKNLAVCHNLGVQGFAPSEKMATEACDRAEEYNWHYYDEPPAGDPDWYNGPDCYSYSNVRCTGTTFTDDFEDLDAARCHGGIHLATDIYIH